MNKPTNEYTLLALTHDGTAYHVSVEATTREDACREIIHLAIAQNKYIKNIWNYTPDNPDSF